MTPDGIQKDRAAGTIDLSPDRIEELAKWLTVDDSNDLPMSGKDSRAIALILRTLTAENAALKERVKELEATLRFYADPDLDGYEIHVTNYGLSTEEGHIIKDAGDKARAVRKALGHE